MLIFFIHFLETLNIKVPSVFIYSSTRMILAVATSLFFTIFFGPLFIKKLRKKKIGQKIREEKIYGKLAGLHKNKKGTPTMGGAFILFSIALSLILWMDLRCFFTWVLAFSMIFLSCIGFLDDYLKLKRKNSRGISSFLKFSLQIVFAVLIVFFLLSSKNFPSVKEKKGHSMEEVSSLKYFSRIYMPFHKKPIAKLPLAVLVIFFILIIVGSSNAVNLTDGLDGLACGCLILVSLVFGILGFLSNNIEISKYLNIPYIEGSMEIAIFLFAVSGALIGFLWYNAYPAEVFMGDIGSLSLGGLLGICAILLKRELLLALVGGIFVIEALSVILQVLSYKYRDKKRIFLCSPLHHHFEYKGISEPKVVMRFWIIALFLAIIGIASLKFQ